MRKRIIRWIVVLAVLAPCLLFSVSAAGGSVVASGYCGGEGDGTNLTWTLYKGGELVIEGTGDMMDYDNIPEPAPWFADEITTEVTKLTICPGVTSIGTGAFISCDRVSSVVIPASVTKVGEYAFYECAILSSAEFLGDAPTEAGLKSFPYDPIKTIIYYHEGTNGWTSGKYYNAKKGTWVDHPLMMISGAPGTDSSVLASGICGGEGDGSNLTWTFDRDGELVISGTGSMVDWGNSNQTPWKNISATIKNITIEDGVTNIGDNAFGQCGMLNNVTIGNSVSTIGSWAFSGCTSLTGFAVSEDNADYCDVDGVLFSKDKTILLQYPGSRGGAYTIPDGVTDIGISAFSRCENLTSVTIPDSVNAIGSGAFRDCTALASVDIGNNVITIDDSAFYQCTNLTEVNIPNSVTHIGADAFSYCEGLTTVAIGDSVTVIGEDAFSCCYNLLSITIPAGVLEIGAGAFYACNSMTGIEVSDENANYCDVDGVLFDKEKTVLIRCPGGKNGAYTVPAGVVTIAENAFYSSALSSVSVPDSVIAIGNHAFDSCDFTTVSLGKGLTAIGNWVFAWSNLTTVVIPADVTTIGDYAFYGCTNLSKVEFCGNIPQTIGWSPFSNCSSTMSIYYHEGTSGWPTSARWQGYPLVVIPAEPERNVIDSGYCGGEGDGTNLTWTLYKGGELVIAGTGAMADWSDSSEQPWYNRSLAIQSVTIENGVTSIGDHAFAFCETMFSVTMSDSVITIGDKAFYYCTGLKIVTLSDRLMTIGDDAFFRCENLTSVDFPDGVTTIGHGAFSWCSRLISVTIPDSVTMLGSEAFFHCYSLTRADIPGSVTTIEISTFNQCANLTTLNIGVGVTTIAANAFYACSSLSWVDIPEGVATIGNSAFLACGNLIGVAIPSSVTAIEAYAFQYCSALRLIELPEKLTTIGLSAFGNCDSLTSVTIPSGVTTMMDGAFGHCDNLSNVTIEEGVSVIGCWAFYNCPKLTEVVIPASVTAIGNGAFSDCFGLKAATIRNSAATFDGIVFRGCVELTVYAAANSTAETYAKENDIPFVAGEYIAEIASGYCGGEGDGTNLTWILYEDGTLVIKGAGAMADWEEYGEAPWEYSYSIRNLSISYGVTSIGSYAFSCHGIDTVAIPDSVSTIGVGAFKDCHSLITVSFGKQVATIGAKAFLGCGSLTEVDIPDSVLTIGDAVFYDCSTLGKVTIGDGVTEIGAKAFDACPNLTDLKLGDSVVTIGTRAFAGGAFSTVVLPDSLTTIEESAFQNCGLRSLTIPKHVTTIGDGAFEWCCELTSVTILDSVAVIGDSAFSGCESLVDLDLGTGITAIESLAFCGCQSLVEVDIPDSVQVLGDMAFADAPNLTAINIGDGVRSIGEWMFDGCASLRSVTIPSGVASIGLGAFSFCDNLTEIRVDSGNTCFASYDGVLYSVDKTVLVCYPAGKQQESFVVPAETREIASGALANCSLAELFLPRTVERVGEFFVTACQGLVVYANREYVAFADAMREGVIIRVVDEDFGQGIKVVAMPQQRFFAFDNVRFDGLRIENFAGQPIDLAQCVITYNPNLTGTQQVTVQYQGLATFFDIVIYDAQKQTLLDFGAQTIREGETAFAAVYDENGRMLAVQRVALLDGTVQMVVDNTDYQQADKGKLMVLNLETFAPAGTATTKEGI